MTVLPNLEVTVAASNFDSAQLGSARWFTLGTDYTPQSICLWQGVNLYSLAFDLVSYFDPSLRRQNGITDAWRAVMDQIAANALADSPYGNDREPLREDSTIRRILARPMASWSVVDQRVITAFIVWFSLYGMNNSPWKNAQIAVDQVTIPADSVPLPFGRYPTPIENPNVNVPQLPVCYPANTRLNPITDDTSRAMPQPLGDVPYETPPTPTNLTTISMEPAMEEGSTLEFFSPLLLAGVRFIK